MKNNKMTIHTTDKGDVVLDCIKSTTVYFSYIQSVNCDDTLNINLNNSLLTVGNKNRNIPDNILTKELQEFIWTCAFDAERKDMSFLHVYSVPLQKEVLFGYDKTCFKLDFGEYS